MSLKSRDTFNNTGVFINAASSSYVGRTTRDTLNADGSSIDFATIKSDSPINNLNVIADVSNFETPHMTLVKGWNFTTSTLPYSIPTEFFLFLLINKNNPIPSFNNGDINWSEIFNVVTSLLPNTLIKDKDGVGLSMTSFKQLEKINPGEGYQVNIPDDEYENLNLLSGFTGLYTYLNPNFHENHNYNDPLILEANMGNPYARLDTVSDYFNIIQSSEFVIPVNNFFKVDSWNYVSQISYTFPVSSVDEWLNFIFNLNNTNNPYNIKDFAQLIKNNEGVFWTPDFNPNMVPSPRHDGVLLIKFQNFDPHHVAQYTDNIIPEGNGPADVEDFPIIDLHSINNNYLNIKQIYPPAYNTIPGATGFADNVYSFHSPYEDIRNPFNNYVWNALNPTKVISFSEEGSSIIDTNIEVNTPYITPSCYLVRYKYPSLGALTKNLNLCLGWAKKPGSDYFPTNLIVHKNSFLNLKFLNSPISGSSISKNINLKNYGVDNPNYLISSINSNNISFNSLDSNITHHNLRPYYDSHSLIQGNASGSNITSSYFFVSSSFTDTSPIIASNTRSYGFNGNPETLIYSKFATEEDTSITTYNGNILGFYQNTHTSYSIQPTDWWLNSGSYPDNPDHLNLLSQYGGQPSHPFIPSLDYLPEGATSTAEPFPLATLKIQTSSIFNSLNPVEVNHIDINFPTEISPSTSKIGNFKDIGVSIFTDIDEYNNHPNIFHLIGDKHIKYKDEFDSSTLHTLSNLTQKISSSNFEKNYILNVGGIGTSESSSTVDSMGFRTGLDENSGSLTFFNPNNNDIIIRYRSDDFFDIKKLQLNLGAYGAVQIKPQQLTVYGGSSGTFNSFDPDDFSLIQDFINSSISSSKTSHIELDHPAHKLKKYASFNNVSDPNIHTLISSDAWDILGITPIFNDDSGYHSMTAQHFSYDTDFLGNRSFTPIQRISTDSDSNTLPTVPGHNPHSSTNKADHNVFHNYEKTNLYSIYPQHVNMTNYSTGRRNEITHRGNIVGYVYEAPNANTNLSQFSLKFNGGKEPLDYIIQGKADNPTDPTGWIDIHTIHSEETLPSQSLLLFPNPEGIHPQDYLINFTNEFGSITSSFSDNFNKQDPFTVGTSSISILYERHENISSTDFLSHIEFDFSKIAFPHEELRVPSRISISKSNNTSHQTFNGDGSFNQNVTSNTFWTPVGEVDFYHHGSQIKTDIINNPSSYYKSIINIETPGYQFIPNSGAFRSNRWKRIKIDFNFYHGNSDNDAGRKIRFLDFLSFKKINQNLITDSVKNISDNKQNLKFRYWRIIYLGYESSTVRTVRYNHKNFKRISNIDLSILPPNIINCKSLLLKFSQFNQSSSPDLFNKILTDPLSTKNAYPWLVYDENFIVESLLKDSLLYVNGTNPGSINADESIFIQQRISQSINLGGEHDIIGVDTGDGSLQDRVVTLDDNGNIIGGLGNTVPFFTLIDHYFLFLFEIMQHNFQINSINLYKSSPQINNLKIGGTDSTNSVLIDSNITSSLSISARDINSSIQTKGYNWMLRQEKTMDFYGFPQPVNSSAHSLTKFWNYIKPTEGFTPTDTPNIKSEFTHIKSSSFYPDEINPLITYEDNEGRSGFQNSGNFNKLFKNNELFNFVLKPVVPLNENNQLRFEYQPTGLENLPYDFYFYDSGNPNLPYQKTSSALIDIKINYKNPYRIETQLQPDNGKSLIYEVNSKSDIDLNNLVTLDDNSQYTFINRSLLSESICLPINVKLDMDSSLNAGYFDEINDILKQASITLPKNFGAKTIIATIKSGSTTETEHIQKIINLSDEQLTSDNQSDRTITIDYDPLAPNSFPFSWGSDSINPYNFYFLNFYDNDIFKIETFRGQKWVTTTSNTNYNKTRFQIRLPKDPPDLFDSKPLIDRNEDY